MATSFKKRAPVTPPAAPKLGRPIDSTTTAALASVANEIEGAKVSTLKLDVPPPANVDPRVLASSSPTSAGWGSSAIGSTVNVPLAAIRPNRFNSRQVFSQADHQSMLKAMSDGIQLEDCIGYVDGGAVTLYSGHRRLRAATDLGWQTLRVRLESAPKDSVDAFKRCDQYNASHKPQSDLDKALVYQKLIEANEVSNAQALADQLGIDKGAMSKLLALAKLPEQVTSLVADVPSMLTTSVLYGIHLFYADHGAAETTKLLANCVDSPLSVREIESKRKQLKAPPVAKPRSARQTFKYGGATGELKRFDSDGRLDFNIKGLSPDALIELEAKVAKLLNAEPELI
ncbi:MAG: ParB N-terminal domain-containing protein [Rhodocyclaceae bacterium]|nr:ParB N-terminal domain-containing protein [Rhodocyclaceae bacterium]